MKLIIFFIFLFFSSIRTVTLNFTIVNGQVNSFFGCGTFVNTQQIFYVSVSNFQNYEPPYFFMNLQIYNYDQTLFNLVNKTFVLVDALQVAAVEPAPGSEFPFGNWELGDIFVIQMNGDKVLPTSGWISRIYSNLTVDYHWVNINNDEFYYYTSQLAFDHTGVVYNGDLLVASRHTIYHVYSNGTYDIIINNPSLLDNYEGIDVVPINDTHYGPLSGTIIVPQNPNATMGNEYSAYYHSCSDNNTLIASIQKDGTVNYYPAGCHADLIYVVHQDVNYYGINYYDGSVYSVTWDDLNAAGLNGEILIMCEPGGFECGGGYGITSGLRRMYWNSQSQKVETEPIFMAGAPQGFQGYWEGGCFSRGGSLNILPAGFNFCFYVNQQATDHYQAITIGITEAQNYEGTNYGDNNFSPNGLPPAQNGNVTISIIQDSLNGFFLQIVNGKPPSGIKAYLDLSLVYNGPYDPNLILRIEDGQTNADSYYWNNEHTQGRFVWSWNSGTTGVVIGPISAIFAMKLFSLDFQVNEVSGIDYIVITDMKKSKAILASNNTQFSISRISCNCGDGVSGDDPFLKKCEYTLYPLCCQSNCQYEESGTLCEKPTNSCMSPSYCTGSSAICPPSQPICNTTKDCNPPYYGPNCSLIDCPNLPNCSNCLNYSSQCSWCYTTNQCIPKTVTCKNSANTCGNCYLGVNCIHGQCQYGNCTCNAGFGGITCNQTYDCNGTLVPPGQKPISVDVCGVCGGNGSECLGCNNKPFGPHLDKCGVCGGNGSECFNPCPGTDCGSCTSRPNCGWCSSDNKCYIEGSKNCSGPMTSDCGGLTPAQIAGISTGAVAGIAIGAAAAVGISSYGAKKGYDKWLKNRENLEGVNENPLYESNGRTGINPLYDS